MDAWLSQLAAVPSSPVLVSSSFWRWDSPLTQRYVVAARTRSYTADASPPCTHIPSHPSLHIDYYSQVEVLTGSTKLEGDPKTIAKNCYFAAVVYAAFIGFCGFQCVTSPLPP